ncbi:MAG TPA: amino acid ABC transporter substrate-binding protein [Casimicrobiaceae bacterium]
MKFSLLALVIASIALAAPDASAQRAPDTLGKIKAAKAINVAFSGDSLPFSYVGEGNKPAGYSIDLCQKVINAVGRAVGEPNLAVNWIPGTAAERVQMVASGKADMECGNTTQTQSRLQSVDFSNLIFVDGGGFAVRADAPINTFADLNGKKIAVIKGTTTEARLNAALKARLVNAQVTTISDGVEGIALLGSGAVDAYAGDKIKLIGLVTQAKEPDKYAMLVEDLSFEPYAFALPRGDPAFRLEVNKALTQVYLGGDIDVIFAKWLGKLGRPSGLLAAMYLLNAIPE